MKSTVGETFRSELFSFSKISTSAHVCSLSSTVKLDRKMNEGNSLTKETKINRIPSRKDHDDNTNNALLSSVLEVKEYTGTLNTILGTVFSYGNNLISQS